MLNAQQIDFMWLFDTTGNTISVLPKIFLRKNKNELIRMLQEQLELISF